jgi:putative Holliday junction resolvase
MKFLGIDYGSKRIGLATADTESGMAFPRSVIKNDDEMIKTLKEIKQKENIEKIILGESKNLDGKDNDITEDIRKFKAVLEAELDVEVIFQPEFYSTYQASRIQGDSGMIDASAAAIILQSYVDRYNK